MSEAEARKRLREQDLRTQTNGDGIPADDAEWEERIRESLTGTERSAGQTDL